MGGCWERKSDSFEKAVEKKVRSRTTVGTFVQPGDVESLYIGIVESEPLSLCVACNADTRRGGFGRRGPEQGPPSWTLWGQLIRLWRDTEGLPTLQAGEFPSSSGSRGSSSHRLGRWGGVSLVTLQVEYFHVL